MTFCKMFEFSTSNKTVNSFHFSRVLYIKDARKAIYEGVSVRRSVRPSVMYYQKPRKQVEFTPFATIGRVTALLLKSFYQK